MGSLARSLQRGCRLGLVDLYESIHICTTYVVGDATFLLGPMVIKAIVLRCSQPEILEISLLRLRSTRTNPLYLEQPRQWCSFQDRDWC